MKRFVIWGAIFAFLAVALGAFGAHALESIFEENGYEPVWETAVQYQMFHAIGLFIIGILMSDRMIGDIPLLRRAGICMIIGTFLFSGSLYVLSVTSIKVLGAITPIGGVLFLVAWAFVLFSAKRILK